ncbi:MAG: PEP-CTERM sorting domain-containing protein [Proteobacteria bacterium]|nr:PEP-CTERM sorting domain-containing protein [Pseudomonadota bacterium]
MNTPARRTLGAIAAGLLLAAGPAALAAPITVSQTYQFLDNVSPNALGIGAGTRQQFGSTCVVLTGNACSPQNLANAQGTTVSATQGGTTLNLSFVASALSSNHWARAGDPAALPDGSWTLTATNGSNTASANTPTLAGASAVGFAQGAAIQQNGQSPTFSWTLPTGGASIDAVTFIVRDVADVRNGISTMIYRQSLAAGATSFTLAPGDTGFLLGNALEFGRQYAIELQLQDTRNNSSNGSFFNVLSQSRTFLNFALSTNTSALQYLPMLDTSSGSPVYVFQGVPVLAGKTVLIDPEVAYGYDYRIGDGDPLFRSVTLPTGVGDDLFDLWLWDGNAWVDAGVDLQGGDEYLFASGGVDRFRITGIETDAGIDPYAAGSFTTGVSFVADGTFNGTMTPLIATVAGVPEPASLLLAGLALAAAGTLRRRQRLQPAARASSVA